MDELIRILAFCQNTCIAGVLLRFLRSVKNGFCRIIYSVNDCCYWCYHRSRSYHHNRAWRKYWLSSLQALYEVKKRLVAGLLVAVLLPSFLISPAYAVTINTTQINGKYYPLTGPLNNPAVGVAVELGSAMLTKANPWVAGIGLGLTVYKIAQELFPGQVVAFRPGLISEKVDTWPSNQPPSTISPSTITQTSYCAGIISGVGPIWADTPEQAGADCYAEVKSKVSQSWDASNPIFNNTFACGGGTHPGGRLELWYNNHTALYCGNASTQNVLRCPSGYVLSGSNCNLSNASIVPYPSDGVSTYINDGAGKFMLDPRDPDIPAANLSGLAGQSSVTQKSTDGKQSSTTTLNPDGSITHSTTNEYYDSTDASTHQFTQSFTINNSGAVISYSSSNPVTQVVNGVVTPVSPSNIQFPNDYNREATQQALKTAITDDIAAANAAKNSLGAGPTGPTYAASELNLPQQSAFQVAPTAPISGLLPTNDGTCVTLPVNLPFFTGLILDPCVVVTAARPFIDWGVMVLGLLSGIFVWFGKTEEL